MWRAQRLRRVGDKGVAKVFRVCLFNDSECSASASDTTRSVRVESSQKVADSSRCLTRCGNGAQHLREHGRDLRHVGVPQRRLDEALAQRAVSKHPSLVYGAMLRRVISDSQEQS